MIPDESESRPAGRHLEAPEPRQIRKDRLRFRETLAAERKRRGRDVPWRRLVRWLRRTGGAVLLNTVGPTAIRLFARSWQIERLGVENFEAATRTGRGFLGALWHGRMLPLAPLHRNQGLGILVSASADGSLVPKVLDRLGYRVIRGSANVRGARALREMRERLEEGGSVVITPDGSIGPRHSMNIGLAWLARETSLPVLTVAVSCDRAWHLNSWDRFTIPKHRARIIVTYGEPITVPPGADDAELERATERIREQLIHDETRGFEKLGVAPDW